MMAKNTHGGRREGSGRKKKEPTEYSDEFKRKVMRALKKKAVELKQSDPFEALADLALNTANQDTVRLGAWKILTEINIVKESKQTVDVTKADKPTIYLPQVLPKPAEAVEREKEAAARFH
jgi:hypothetical protein